jgi:hypothetical protein
VQVTHLRGFADELVAIHSDRGAPPDFHFHKTALMRKLALGLDSASMLGQSFLAHHGPDAVAGLARANPGVRSGLLGAVKKTVGVGGGRGGVQNVMTTQSNPLRAAASGTLGKLASGLGNWGHAAEIGGLGILAKPSIDEMRGKEVAPKRKAGTELAGLGVLAAPSAYELGQSALKKYRGRPAVSQALTRL